ncbi:hypothetical protein JOC74_002638 [Bacillus capparidis]|uniref:Uncharacterized protein n=1 Tax=Bacillus capparidis TaxID=1840411 RepID=A0ABS4CX28_9BACI|nr:hypothetical protein [Bacillus capparidis]
MAWKKTSYFYFIAMPIRRAENWSSTRAGVGRPCQLLNETVLFLFLSGRFTPFDQSFFVQNQGLPAVGVR